MGIVVPSTQYLSAQTHRAPTARAARALVSHEDERAPADADLDPGSGGEGQPVGPEVALIEVISAALLAAGRPVKARELAPILGVSAKAVERLVGILRARLAEANLGMDVEEVAGGYRFIVPPPVAARLEPLLAPLPLPGLSGAALETLAIIAYRQPVTRGEIEVMRGASAGSTLVTLQERELVKVVGRREVVGRPLLYGTTEKFLLEFGLPGLADLPALEGDEPPGAFLRG